MKRALQVLRTCWYDMQGADVAEYAVLASVILLAVIVTARYIGNDANLIFGSTKDALDHVIYP